MNSYEAKQARRRQRLEERAAAARAEAESRFGQVRRMGEVMQGEPIKVGHHSERRHRRDAERMHENMGRAVAAAEAADDMLRRAASVGSAGISADDPDALVKLRERLAELSAQRDQYRAHNRLHRGSARTLPPYVLANHSANMRRIEQRIRELTAAAAAPPVEPVEGTGWRAVEDREDNRLRICFTSKPSEEIRAFLRSSGFRWSPTAAAWQRQISDGARWVVRELQRRFEPA